MKQKDRFWNILIVICLAVLVGIGVCTVLLFPEKPPAVTVESVSPPEEGTAAEVTGGTDAAQRALIPVTGTVSGVPASDASVQTETQPPDTNLNTADEAALRRVSGVGEMLAARICAYRAQIGGFTRRAQLLEIEGIGETIAARIMEEFAIPDELPPETVPPQTSPEQASGSSGSTARSTAKTTAETDTQTEPVLPPKRDINTVTEEELLEIPGMNAARAASVIRVRGQIGRYSDLHELAYCEGLTGDYIFNTLFEYLYIEETETGSAEP